MSGRITVWGASELLSCFFTRNTEPPASFWLALIRTAAPTPYMSGLELDEPTVDDYSRIEILNDNDDWSNLSQPHVMASVLPVTFNTATTDWGQIGYWALCNLDAGGMCYFVGDLENPLQVEIGDQVVVAEEDLSVSLGPFFMAEEV
jgi:hypothetical protein